MEKIILIGPTAPKFKGGITHYTYNLYQEFRKQGYNIDLVSFKRAYPKEFFPGGQTQDQSEKLFIIKQEKTLLDWLNPASWLKTFLYIQKSKPDLVILQWWTWFWVLPYFIILLLLKLTKLKVVIIVHNLADHEQTSWKKALAQMVLRFADKLVANSSEIKASLQDVFPKKKIVFALHPLYDFIKPKQLISQTQAQAKLGVRSPLLLFFGHVRAYKGLDLLINALVRANKKLAKSVQLLIAGEFWEDKQLYLDLIYKLVSTDNIKIQDQYIPNEKVSMYFQACDAVVIPYRKTTGAGPAKIALAFNKPLLATKTGDNLDLFKVARVGKLVEPNIDSLSQAIIEFAREPKQKYLKQIEKVKLQLSWDKLVTKITNE